MFGIIPIWTSWGFEYHEELKLVRTTVQCKEKGKEAVLLGVAVRLIDIVNERFKAVLYPELLLSLNETPPEGTMVTFGIIFESDEEVTKFKEFLFKEFFPK